MNEKQVITTVEDIMIASVARPLAPEDIQPKMHIAVLRMTGTVMPFVCSAEELRTHGVPLVDVQYTPGSVVGPFKVVEVCLPFVLVKNTRGKVCVLDVRRNQFAQLPGDTGRNIFRALRKQAKAIAKAEAKAEKKAS